MKIALSQSLFRLGDFEENYKKALESLEKAKKAKADLLVFPEGGLWSYPPKDFLYDKGFYKAQQEKLLKLKKKLPASLSLLMPGFYQKNKKIQNVCFLIKKTGPISFFAKEFLPDQEVFFESRYFTKGQSEENFFYLKGKSLQLLICEDLWQDSPKSNRAFKKRDLFISVNASPYRKDKKKDRWTQIKALAKQSSLGAVYLNLVGAQDSLLFDGGSLLVSPKGERLWQGAYFEEDFVCLNLGQKKVSPPQMKKISLQEEREKALVLGIREFFYQTGFSKACLGLSGGIDSALVSYLAVQALGADKVQAYFLPTKHTRKISYQLVELLGQNLKLKVFTKSIEPLRLFFEKDFIKKPLKPLTKQNLQSRLRLLYLMTQANESGALLLGTGNKSELSLGYSTLYGDLSGALLPIGDLLKTELYDLVLAINKKRPVFPEKLISREPTAELAPGQMDSKDLGSYKELDAFLKELFNKREFSQAGTKKQSLWLSKIQRQEFKRNQAPPILKLSEHDLGESWRYPISHRFLK